MYCRRMALKRFRGIGYYLVTVRRGRKVPSPPSTGSAHGPHLFGRSRCHQSGRHRTRSNMGRPPPWIRHHAWGGCHRRGHVGWTTAPPWLRHGQGCAHLHGEAPSARDGTRRTAARDPAERVGWAPPPLDSGTAAANGMAMRR